MQVECTTPLVCFEDQYHVDLRQASPTNCLITHPSMTKEQVECVYTIPGFPPIVVPGLGESVFHSPIVSLYLASGKATAFQCVRLPGIHVLLNQALKAYYNAAPYDWSRFQTNLEEELLAMLGQVVNSRAMRTSEGDGFMALAQANPNQPQDVIGVGVELAQELAQALKRIENKSLAKMGKTIKSTFSLNDLNGLLIRTCLRFPATRSSGVKRWMTLRVVGRGRCCWLHPIVLKEHMLGDVDGDEIYAETDPRLRHKAYDPFVVIDVPSIVYSLQNTIGLSACEGKL